MGDLFRKEVNQKTERKTADFAADVIAAIKTSKTLKVVVKPNNRNNEIAGYSDEKKAWLISVKAAAKKDEANKELLKFLKKETGKIFRIKSGLHGRNKLLAADR